MAKIARFRGLNNVEDTLGMGADWLTLANNVNVTDRGKLAVRDGYTRAMAGAFTSAYSTIDFTRMYVVDGAALKAMASSSTAITLASGLDDADMHWTEINGQVFYNNGTDRGIITADNTVLPWAWTVPATPGVAAVTGSLDAGLYQVRCTFTLADGRETGASDSAELVLSAGSALQISGIPQEAGCTTNVYIAPANSTKYELAASDAPAAIVWNASPDNLGRELLTELLDPLPEGCDVIQAWSGSIYAAHYSPAQDQTAIWISKPLGFHLFDLREGFFMVPGRVLMLAPHAAGLVIGTDVSIDAYDGKTIAQLAPYGVVPGRHWSEDDDKTVIFWSTRGVCRALPFVNLTERFVSVAPGVSAGGAIVRSGGQKRFVAAIQQGGSAFNQH